jgi:hypothetical protein
MVKKKKKLFGKRIPRPTKQEKRRSETVQLVNELLLAGDVVQLRKVASARGLVSSSLRKRAWQYLLGTRGMDIYGHDSATYLDQAGASHKDAAVVDADVDRSLWKYNTGWSDQERNSERNKLKNMINACVEGNRQGVFYYQGLHDVASVLLLVCGEGAAHGMLHRLMRCHLRDCTRSTIDPAIRTLRLLYPILRHADEELYTFIHGLNEPALEMPYFALSWYMTWFAHDVDSLDDISRLFDLFLGSHPMMPLYVAVEVLVGARKQIFKSGSGPGQGELVYSFLNKLPVTDSGRPNVDDLCRNALALFKDVPPHLLTSGKLKRDQLASSCIPFAYLDQGRWQVPAVDDSKISKNISSHSLGGGRVGSRWHQGLQLEVKGFRLQLQTVALGSIAIVVAGAVTILSDSWPLS